MTPATDGRGPVFVVGCPRSGTTLLYHMLVSSGEFANYRAETHLYDMMLPHFGSFARRENRERFLERWLKSYYFERTGLDADEVSRAILDDCRSGADFLEIVLGRMARAQGVPRWAECTPAHVLHMRTIKKEIPSARFLHIVRDGRDAAISINKLGWAHPLPWDRDIPVQVSGWMWQWMVDHGRHDGSALGSSYQEVRFEDLVTDPARTLERLSPFVGKELDYAAIQANAVGSVEAPNTAFPGDSKASFNPVGRFRKSLSEEELAQLEAAIGDTLTRHGYERVTKGGASAALAARRGLYRSYREGKLIAKSRTGLGRWLSSMDMAT